MPTLELPALYADTVASIVAVFRPLLANRDPGPGEIGVVLESAIALEIIDPGIDGIDRAGTRVWVDGELAFDGSSVPELQPGFDGPRAGVTETLDTLRIVIDPATAFLSEALVAVRVVSQANGGVHVLDQSYTFRAEDRTAPRVVSAQAISQREVQIGFDEEIEVTGATGFSFEAMSLPAVPISPVGALATGTTVTLIIDTEMSPDVPYRVVVSGVADVFGNAVLAPDNTTTFLGDLWRFIACLQEAFDLLLAEVDRYPDIFDLERAPGSFLDLILRDLGNPFPFELDELAKRRLASVLVEMYRQKGTAIGIENAIRFFLGIDITAITAFTGTTLVLGEAELGVDWELGPSDLFARYAFDVEVDVPLSDTERRQIRAIVDYLKPAHTHFVDLIEPGIPPTFDHWELGVSELGVETELH
ncbi:MAG: phage tail protein [Proteobacteria bacterium]|nr:MAG: phage tail protein [Pseudomonadota bacterium]